MFGPLIRACTCKLRLVSVPCVTQAPSSSCTELETAMINWLARALNLPEFFIHGGKGPGGGVLQGTLK